MPGSVECPRCGRVTQADGIWLWVAGQGERLRVENGSIVQSGHVDVFDLGCGCKFDADLWTLSVRTAVSVRAGVEVGVDVVAKPAIPDVQYRELLGAEYAVAIREILNEIGLTPEQETRADTVTHQVLRRHTYGGSRSLPPENTSSYHTLWQSFDPPLGVACECPLPGDHNANGQVLRRRPYGGNR